MAPRKKSKKSKVVEMKLNSYGMLQFPGIKNREFNYILENRLFTPSPTITITRCGFLKKWTERMFTYFAKIGKVVMAGGEGGYTTVLDEKLKQDLAEVILERKCKGFVLPVTFESFNPKEVSIKVRNGKKKKKQDENILEGGCYENNPMITCHHNCLLEFDRSSMKWTYFDVGLNEEKMYDSRFRDKVRTQLVPVLVATFGLPQPPIPEGRKRRPEMFQTHMNRYFTGVDHSCGLICIYLIEEMLKDKEGVRDWRSLEHSMEYGNEILQFLKTADPTINEFKE